MAESSSHDEMMMDTSQPMGPSDPIQQHHHALGQIEKDMEHNMDPEQLYQYMSQIVVTEGMKRMIIDLQRQWLTDYHSSREKTLVELTEKLHAEFLNDQQKIRADLLQQFKEELEQTRNDLDEKYQADLKTESVKLAEKHKRELAAAKKKQWCWSCDNEAIYHCCWNTAYCSVECQQGHWSTHRKFCRRKKAGAGAPGNSGAVMAAQPPAPPQPQPPQPQNN